MSLVFPGIKLTEARLGLKKALAMNSMKVYMIVHASINSIFGKAENFTFELCDLDFIPVVIN